MNTAAWNILPHPAEAGMPAGLGVVEGNEIPYRPEAPAKQREHYANRATKVFTRPWKMRMPLYRRLDPNMQILEYECYQDAVGGDLSR